MHKDEWCALQIYCRLFVPSSFIISIFFHFARLCFVLLGSFCSRSVLNKLIHTMNWSSFILQMWIILPAQRKRKRAWERKWKTSNLTNMKQRKENRSTGAMGVENVRNRDHNFSLFSARGNVAPHCNHHILNIILAKNCNNLCSRARRVSSAKQIFRSNW